MILEGKVPSGNRTEIVNDSCGRETTFRACCEGEEEAEAAGLDDEVILNLILIRALLLEQQV